MKDRRNRVLQHLPLFVYGTLMQGCHNSKRLGEVAKMPPLVGKVVDHVMVSLGAFPGLIAFENFEAFGELYPVQDLPDTDYERLIAGCDLLEGEGSFYHRKVIEVQLPGGEKLQAYAYLLDATYLHRHEVVYNGCWQERGESVRREWMNLTVSGRGFTPDSDPGYSWDDEDDEDVADDGEDEDIDLIEGTEELEADDYRLWN